MRLEGKVAIIVGAGQSPGEGIGNGRATTLRFAQEGARILAVDRIIASAEETAAMATQGGECVPFAADVTKEETLATAMEAARARWGRIDILHKLSQWRSVGMEGVWYLPPQLGTAKLVSVVNAPKGAPE